MSARKRANDQVHSLLVRKLWNYMHREGLTEKELAKETNIPYLTIYRWFKERNIPQGKQRLRLKRFIQWHTEPAPTMPSEIPGKIRKIIKKKYYDAPFHVFTRSYTDLEGNELEEIVIQPLAELEMIINTSEFKEWKKTLLELPDKNRVFYDDELQLVAKFKKQQKYQNKPLSFDLPQKISRKKKKELDQSIRFQFSSLFEDD